MLDKRMTIEEAVSLVKNGDTIMFGGWGVSRKPMAIVRQIIRSNLKDLTIVSMGCLDADMLIVAGKVKKLMYGFLGYHQVPGIPNNCRRVRRDGSVHMVELSEGMLVTGLKAAAERLPFLPTRSGLGTDVLTMNPNIKTINCPYTGESLVAMPAIRADIAFLHVNAATTSGYGCIGGDAWLDLFMARAAKQTIISTEKLLPLKELKEQYSTVDLLRLWVKGVVELPYGAHPTSCYPQYGIDQAKLDEYTRASATPEGSAAYLDKYVKSIRTQSDYVDIMGGAARLSQIPYR